REREACRQVIEDYYAAVLRMDANAMMETIWELGTAPPGFLSGVTVTRLEQLASSSHYSTYAERGLRVTVFLAELNNGRSALTEELVLVFWDGAWYIAEGRASSHIFDEAPLDSLFAEPVWCDLDGDGVREEVTLRDFNGLYVHFTLGGTDYAERLGMSAYHPALVKAIDFDGDGREELVVYASMGGQGGWGSHNLVVLSLQDGVLRKFSPRGGYGRAGSGAAGNDWTGNALNPWGRLQPGFKAELFAPESGHVFTFAVGDEGDGWYDYLIQRRVYDEDGSLLSDVPIAVDSIGALRLHPERGTLEIAQYVWYIAHSHQAGLLITELLYTNDGLELVDQRFDKVRNAEDQSRMIDEWADEINWGLRG
ncbi:MAG: VCBS repeat-containing protein, partial [Oscillospiraceae bacterium]|nr:VCBS repeat-containing protein [Oscillospiraceae bacterium]